MCYFDMFSIHFSGDTLMAGSRTYPLGEITTEFLRLSSDFFKNLQIETDDFITATREMLASKKRKLCCRCTNRNSMSFSIYSSSPHPIAT